MFRTEEAIEHLRQGKLDIDCYRMTLTQEKDGGERFEGQGYIRQANDGFLIFKIYVSTHNGGSMQHLQAQRSQVAGKIVPAEAYYTLEATAHDGTCWSAKRILPKLNWGMTDEIVLIQGQLLSMTAPLDMSAHQHVMKLHFFEEYDIPCTLMSENKDHDRINRKLDRMEFTAAGADFEIRQHAGKDTTVKVSSDSPFPIAFDLRVQEAFQYMIAKPAFWRARLQSHDGQLHIELASPFRKSPRTQFSTPISAVSADYRKHGWRLFAAFLAYVIEKTPETHWNAVAYHLHGAYEATANSIDARAVGLCVAVEAIAGLVELESDAAQAREVEAFQKAARTWLKERTDFSKTIANRANGLINAMDSRRPQDTLRSLALKGLVERDYIGSWSYLRNRYIHPRLKDLRIPTALDKQKLLDSIHKVEVLLRQLTLHLIGYDGYFTDYGVSGFPSKKYPLEPADPAASASVAAVDGL